MKKIKKYLENVAIPKDDQKTMLKYLRLSSELNFRKPTQDMLDLLKLEPFPWLQTYKEFSLLPRYDQIYIAILRLNTLNPMDKLLKDLLSVFDN